MSQQTQKVSLGTRFLAWLKESLRKRIVGLKRNPQIIPTLVLVFSFLFFSFNLTAVSNTTAKVQGAGMGLCQFCTTLFSLLSMVCMLNAFPKRKKANIPMVVLLFVMLGIIVFCNMHYLNGIAAALTRAESPIPLNQNTAYIAKAFNMLATHNGLIYTTAALVALLPVYSKLIRKINTSVDVEDNGDLAEIELSE